jgi:hypothetical protein
MLTPLEHHQTKTMHGRLRQVLLRERDGEGGREGGRGGDGWREREGEGGRDAEGGREREDGWRESEGGKARVSNTSVRSIK